MSKSTLRTSVASRVESTLLALALALSPAVAFADKPAPLSAQSLKAPSGPTALKGLGESFAANPSTGTGSYTVPLLVAPGFVAPTLNLNYTGGSGKGELGVGFTLPLLQIYRQTDKGAPSFTESDRFAVSGPDVNDELVLADAATGSYRLKNNGAAVLFRRSATEDSWTIYFADGSKAVLGETIVSRAQALGKTSRWFVETKSDVHGHIARYRYIRDAGKVYCKGIDYQGEASASYRNRIELEYETRPDVLRDFRYGDEQSTALRLAAVDVFQGARRLRRYSLRYQSSSITSQLHTVELEGENGLRLPTLTLSYLAASTHSGHFVKVEGYRTLSGLDTGRMTLEDVNGDGLPDLLNGASSNYEYYENLDGVRFAGTPTALGGSGSPDRNLDDPGVVYADVDGDGFRDVWVPASNGQFRFFAGGNIKAGVFKGFAAARVMNGNGVLSDLTRPDARLTDLNSDGRVDFIYQRPGLGDVWLENQGTQLVQRSAPTLPSGVQLSNPGLELIDFNGDGALDLVQREFDGGQHDLRVWFGLGSGKYLPNAAVWGAPVASSREIFLSDVDRDGQADLVRVSGSWVEYYLNDGRGSFAVAQGSFRGMPETSNTKKVLLADMNGNGTTDVVWLTQDAGLSYLDLMAEPNAGLLSRVDDGMGAITDIGYRASTEYMIEAKLRGERWTTTLPHPVPVIAEVSSRDSLERLAVEGWESRVIYDYRDGFYDGKEREFRGFARVTSTQVGDAQQESTVTELGMHVGRNLTTGADEEGLKGKIWLELVRSGAGDLLSSKEVRWEQRWLCREDLPAGTPAVLPSCAGITDKTANKDKLVASAIAGAELDGAWERRTTPRYSASRTSYDVWGKATRVESFGEVTIPGGHQLGQSWSVADLVVGTGSDERITETDYASSVSPSDGAWRLGFPSEQRLKTLAGTVVSLTRNYYDGVALVGLPLGRVDRGLLARREAWLAQEARFVPVERTAFNADGMPQQRMDATGYATTLAYDPETHWFPVEERLPLEGGRSAVFSGTYDRGFGVLTSLTDPNGQTTQYRYDGLARLAKILDPRATEAEPSTSYSYRFGTPESPLSTTTVQQLVVRGEGKYRTSIEYSDAFGRTRLVKQRREGDYVASGWKTFTRGGTVKETFDAFISASAEFEAAPDAAPSTWSTFDALGRVLEEHLPATTTQPSSWRTKQYLPFENRSFDERDSTEGTLAYPTIERVDGLGRVTSIERTKQTSTGPAALSWTLGYDVRGKLVSLVDPSRIERGYDYDSLGRLRNVTDPNLGSISYSFDDADRPTLRVDALGQRQTSEYGESGRLTHQQFQAKGADGLLHDAGELSYHYDLPKAAGPLSAPQNLIGRLSYLEYPVGADHFSYDERGLLSEQAAVLWDGKSPLDNQVRTTHLRSAAFDAAGAEVSRQLPGGFSLATARDARGLVQQVTAGLVGDTRVLATDSRYDARGQLLSADFGNGLRACRSWDARQQLTGLLLGHSSILSCSPDEQTNPQLGEYHVAYTWGYDRTLSSVADRSVVRSGVARLDATFEYDRLQELTRATTAYGAWSYDYDEVQNLVSKTKQLGSAPGVVTTFTYGESAGPNAVTHEAANAYGYDALGQLKAYNGFDLQYDVLGRLVSATKPGGKAIRYYYDPMGERRVVTVSAPGAPVDVSRYPLPDYEQHGADELWRGAAPGVNVELRRTQGLRIDAALLDDLTAYLATPQSAPKPLPEEWLDLDGDGDGFDAGDLAEAKSAFWEGRLAGSARVEWRYTHTDHLQSTQLTTDGMGDVVSERRYEPYGGLAQRIGAQSTRGYAGTEVDPEEELGLMRMGARYYAPALGRFISPDRFIGESPERMVRDPLQSNLYSYARNNPLSFVDPSGADSIEYDSKNFDDVKYVSEKACSAGDHNALRIAKWGQMKWFGLGQEMLNHYLSGKGGTVEIDLRRMLDGDALMQSTLKLGIVTQAAEQLAQGYSGGQINGSVFISQDDYSNEDNQMAMGGTYVYWHVDSSPAARAANKKNGGTRVVVELIDVYFWSPHQARATQCMHEAAERLKADGAKEFVQHGSTTIVIGMKDGKVFKPGDGEVKIRQGQTEKAPPP